MKLNYITVPRTRSGRTTRHMSVEDTASETIRSEIQDRIRAIRSGSSMTEHETEQLLNALTCVCALLNTEDIGDIITVGNKELYVYLSELDQLPYSMLIDSIDLVRQWDIWSKPFTLGGGNGR